MSQSPYRERVLDHYQNPRHRGHLDAPDGVGEIDNPVCGDAVRIELRFDDDGRVGEAAFSGQGCVLSMAAASMLAERIHGQSVAELRALTDQDMLDMLGVELGPVRTQCAVLPRRALEEALKGGE